MMLFHLLKKDFLLVKKYVLIMVIVAALIPPFMLWRSPEYTGILGFMLSVIFSVFMLLQYASQKEYQFPKAATLLCATPFSRKMMVLSKYVFCMVIYVVCCFIYGIETVTLPGLGILDVKPFIFMFFVTAVFIGIYLPMQYKLGYEKTKFAFMVIIMASPIILPFLMKTERINGAFLSAHSPLIVYAGTVLFAVLFLAVSTAISIRFYENAELA